MREKLQRQMVGQSFFLDFQLGRLRKKIIVSEQET